MAETVGVNIDPSQIIGLAGAVQVATVTLSSAQILALTNNVGVDIAAGQAGKILVPLTAMLQLKFGTTPYTLPDTSQAYLAIGYGPPATVGDQVLSALLEPGGAELLTATENAVEILGFDAAGAADAVEMQSAVGDTQATLSGAPISIWFNDPGSPTLGDGTLAVTVFYAVVDLS